MTTATTTVPITPEVGKTAARKGKVLADQAGRYLTFLLAGRQYAINVQQVWEIVGVQDLDAPPQVPARLKGVVHLRGRVIPVADLRRKFGLAEVAHTEQTCIIVVNVGRLVGVIVDAVCHVWDVAGDDIVPPPSGPGSVDSPLLLGIAKVRGADVNLLDLGRVLPADELRRF